MNKLLEQLLKAEAKAKDVIEKEGSTSEEIKAITTEIQAIKAKIEAQKILDVMENERIEVQAAADLAAAKPVNTPLYAEPKDHTKAIWKKMVSFLRQFIMLLNQESLLIKGYSLLMLHLEWVNQYQVMEVF